MKNYLIEFDEIFATELEEHKNPPFSCIGLVLVCTFSGGKIAGTYSIGTGTLIYDRYVLTAAHVVEKKISDNKN